MDCCLLCCNMRFSVVGFGRTINLCTIFVGLVSLFFSIAAMDQWPIIVVVVVSLLFVGYVCV